MTHPDESGQAAAVAVARFVTADGSVAGAGFLVAEQTVVTCAHVARALGGAPGTELTVWFPHAAGSPRLIGRVVPEAWRDADDGDIAVLRLGAAPEGVRPLGLGSAVGCRGHAVRSYGFPRQAPVGGHYGYAVAGDLLPDAPIGPLLQLTNANDLTTGFSGAPVLNDVTGLVVGMVTAITRPDPHQRGQGIAYATPTEILRDVCPELAVQDVCPYRGLETFTAADARWFHGRDDAVDRMLTALGAEHPALLLLGPSGSGKSSLIQAGVLPALADGRLPRADRWLAVFARPGEDLSTELVGAGLHDLASSGAWSAVDQRLAGELPGTRLLLVIDQVEEALTEVTAARAADLRRLTAAVGAHPALTVLLVMRDDFYPRLAAVAPDLLEAALPGVVNVPAALTTEELSAIIKRPADAAGARLEDGLTDRIISDLLTADPGGPLARRAPVALLPLLELTLEQLWHRRSNGHLTHNAYQRVGEISGSLARWCDRAIGELPAEQRPIARRILTALVHPADETHRVPAARRQVPLATLRELAGAVAEPAAVDEVLAVLTRHRVVTTRRVAPPGVDRPSEPVAELVHDALIRDWGALREWVAQDRRFHDWMRRAEERQLRWRDTADPDDLLHGTDLAEGLAWSRRQTLPRETAAYLAASKHRQQAAIRRTRRVNGVLAALVVVAVVAAGVAFWQRQDAVRSGTQSLSRQLAAQSRALHSADPQLAALLAVHAYRVSPTVEATASLYAAAGLASLNRLTGLGGRVETVAFQPGGKRLAALSDGTVRLWDVATGRGAGEIAARNRHISSVAFSPDGNTLATGEVFGAVSLWSVDDGRERTTLTDEARHTPGLALAFSSDRRTFVSDSSDNTIKVWDLAAGRVRARLTGHTAGVIALAVAPDGKTLASSARDGTVRLWDLATGRSRGVLPNDREGPWVVSIAFSPDGQTLAGAGGRAVRLWDVGRQEVRAALPVSNVASVEFSPDGTRIATGGDDNQVRLWDAGTGQIQAVLPGHTDAVRALAFSPDGRLLASGSADQTIRLWDPTITSTRAVLTRPGVRVAAAAFSPDGSTLAVGDDDDTVSLWDLKSGRIRSTLPATNDHTARSLAYSPDGRTLAVGSDTVRLWDPAAARLRRTLPTDGPLLGVDALAFSPDGRTLAYSYGEGEVRLWEVATGRTRAALTGFRGRVTAAAFTPDGRTLATAGWDSTVRLWDPANGRSRAVLAGHTQQVSSVTFSPDGRTLASAGDDATVRWWDVATGRATTTLSLPDGGINITARLSPDGRTLAVGNGLRPAQLWDVASGQPYATFSGYTKAADVVAFSPDGRGLAVGDGDTVWLGAVEPPDPARARDKLCRALHRDLTDEEWSTYLPGAERHPACRAR
ncbi:hypothetical protein V6V47_03495 [Micromonospora sp. CPCC 205539]|uniref:nSTAND1 domain-containing NTPase n=1 Tax=Micromonospora sp. CPCC 205539 TaxID=3122408 RepID=UPI002FEE8F22